MNKIHSYLVAIVLGCVAQVVSATPTAEYWAMWDVGNDVNTNTIDHGQWDSMLKRFTVSEPTSGVVDFRYGDIDKDARKELNNYIRHLEKIDPREYSRLEQKAYWMNLYNALSVQAVLENFDDLKASGFTQRLDKDVWDKDRIKIAREKLSLNDIEHRILRPIWKDHRVLFGLNCTTRDCPNLSADAYTAATIKDQLSSDSMVNLMDQYYPHHLAHKYKELDRAVSRREYKEAYLFAQRLGLRLAE